MGWRYKIKFLKRNEIIIFYDLVMNKNLILEEFTEKLEGLLRKNRIGIIERRKIIRLKQQEFNTSQLEILILK